MDGGVDTTSVMVMVGTAAVAGLLVMAIAPKLVLPVVVVELLLGIAIGPQGFDFAEVDPTTDFLGDLGLGMLFFFAGYEIDFQRIKGKPLTLGTMAWILSLVLAYGLGGLLAAAGVIVSYLYTGSAMATTAIGTLIPILKDAGELKTRFGTFLLAGGAMGEFGPILLITLILSAANPLHEAVVLILFVVAAVFTGPARGALGLEGLAADREDPRDHRASSRCASRSCSSSASPRWRPTSGSTCCWAASSPG